MQKIVPFLWFKDDAEEVMKFYTSVFKNSTIKSVSRQDNVGPTLHDTMVQGILEINGQELIIFSQNFQPPFTFTEAISLFVQCDTQEEIDELWEKLTEGGEEVQCGWLKDKYGLSWQIVPSILEELLQSGHSEKSKHVMEALLQMKKISIEQLQDAYNRE